jgi:hypothetical protein
MADAMNGGPGVSRTDGGVCEHCGNRYDKAFTLVLGGKSHVFDSFECAIHAVAPRCAHCGGAIIGHGVEADARMDCCAHCAARSGVPGLVDRTGPHV